MHSNLLANYTHWRDMKAVTFWAYKVAQLYNSILSLCSSSGNYSEYCKTTNS